MPTISVHYVLPKSKDFPRHDPLKAATPHAQLLIQVQGEGSKQDLQIQIYPNISHFTVSLKFYEGDVLDHSTFEMECFPCNFISPFS